MIISIVVTGVNCKKYPEYPDPKNPYGYRSKIREISRLSRLSCIFCILIFTFRMPDIQRTMETMDINRVFHMKSNYGYFRPTMDITGVRTMDIWVVKI